MELEIFRQLQIQRQEVLTPPDDQAEGKEDNTIETKDVEQKSCDAEVPNSPGHGKTAKYGFYMMLWTLFIIYLPGSSCSKPR